MGARAQPLDCNIIYSNDHASDHRNLCNPSRALSKLGVWECRSSGYIEILGVQRTLLRYRGNGTVHSLLDTLVVYWRGERGNYSWLFLTG